MIKLSDRIQESKFDIHKTKDFWFVTYGGLSLTKQKGFDPLPDSFHSPPARKGIYAFVWPYIEKFLLGGYNDPKERGKGARQRIQYVRDKSGNIIDNKHSEYEKCSEIQKNWSFSRNVNEEGIPKDFVLYNNVNRKKFKYGGPLWHHFINEVPEHSVYDRHGDWVKTDMTAFQTVFKKNIHKYQYSFTQKGYFPFAMDDLEIFIDQKI